MFTATVCQAEVMAGIAVLPEGRCRSTLQAAAQALFGEDFSVRVLTFDAGGAVAYGEDFAARKRAGRATAPLDLMVAAVARSNGARVVTRDAAGSAGCGVPLQGPWQVS